MPSLVLHGDFEIAALNRTHGIAENVIVGEQ
jgi:hypothetical protein